MLIQIDKNELGDKRLNEVEGVAKLKEENRKLHDANRIPDQDTLEDKRAAHGMPMSPNELIRRIQNLNHKIIVEPGGAANAVAVRHAVKQPDGTMTKEYITGFYIDQPMPEFSCVVVDNKGLPVREVRGWRTVLLALMNVKLLSLKQVELTFGKANGQRAILWDRTNQARNK
jgi:hypothetical protein